MTHARGFGMALLAATLALGGSTARAGHGANVSLRDGGDPETCSDLAIEFDDRPADRRAPGDR